MARITPPTGNTLTTDDLQDHEAYKGILTAHEWSEGAAEYGGGQRLQVDWQLDNGENIRDWISLRLGKQKAGGVSKLRQLLNALSDKPADTEVAWFDTESLEWGYDANGAAHNKLFIGAEVVLRGQFAKKADGGDKFVINVYQAPKRAAAKVAAKKLVPVGVQDDEVPF